MIKPHQIQIDNCIGAKVLQLRTLLMTSETLNDVSDYFHNSLALDESFFVAGEWSSNPRLLAALQAELEIVAPEGKLGTAFLISLPEQAFCHGYSSWGKGHVVFFYFEQLDLGFLSYSPSLRSVEVTFVRFSMADAFCAATWGAAKRRERGCA